MKNHFSQLKYVNKLSDKIIIKNTKPNNEKKLKLNIFEQ